MAYVDPTETRPEDRHPKKCPLCGGALAVRWVGHRHHSRRSGYSATAYTLFVCETCEVTVQLARLPSKPMRKTKKAARADVHKGERDRPRILRQILSRRS